VATGAAGEVRQDAVTETAWPVVAGEHQPCAPAARSSVSFCSRAP
jgi:hypothetical protein